MYLIHFDIGSIVKIIYAQHHDFHTFCTNSRSSHGNIAKLPLVTLSGTDVDTDIQPSQVRPKVTTQVTQDEGTIIVDLNTRTIDMP